jgi:hypothetical protein
MIGDHLWRVTIPHHKSLIAISNDDIESVIESVNVYRRVQFELCYRITHHIILTSHHPHLLSIIIRIIILDRLCLTVIVLLV